MFLVALVPPLWFRVMDPILLQHVERDPKQIHFDPKRREALCKRYGLADEDTTAVSSLAYEDGQSQEQAA
jgi:alkane 1-monooxygenase